MFPNPWKAALHGGVPVTFDRLGAGATVRLFTVSGRPVRTFDAPAGLAVWDLRDDGGRTAASGVYLYLITGGDGTRRSGVVGVVR